MAQITQSALIQVRVDESVKNKADALFADLGFDTPTAIRIFLNQAIRREGMPFDVAKPKNDKTEEEALDKQISAVLKKLDISRVRLEADENGDIIIDEEVKAEHPDVYDWAVNG